MSPRTMPLPLPLPLLLTLALTLLLTLVGHSVLSAHALVLPQAISSHMVLQRAPQRAQLWGTTTVANGVVSATLGGNAAWTWSTFADDEGNWLITLPPFDASTTAYTLKIYDDVETILLTDILFGDVWLCGGQSNMEFVLPDAFNATEAIEQSSSYTNLRLLTVADNASNVSLNDTKTRFPNTSGWQTAQPKYLNGSIWTYFSAACYFFGSDLYVSLNQQVPIGLVESCYGGTTVEPWTSPEGLKTCGPVIPPPAAALEQEARISGPHGPKNGSVLWNAMIAPLTNMPLTGVIWYQGESNAWNATNYACRFPALINDWRNHWNNYKQYFLFVLLAGYKAGNSQWAPLRAAQLDALQLPYTGVATAQDLGDPASPEGDIHPRYKLQVGQRLSRVALDMVYGQSVLSQGPSYVDVVWPVAKSSAQQTVIFRFDASSPYSQDLQLGDTTECTSCCTQLNGTAITLRTTDGVMYDAVVSVLPDVYLVTATIEVAPTAPNVYPQVDAAYYNYVAYPQCTLYNGAGLPHLPFLVERE